MAAAAVAVHVGGAVLVCRPRAVQLVLGLTAAGTSPASPAGVRKAGLGLRRLPGHHVLRHEHSGGSLLGNAVDLAINEYHDDPRREEGHEAGGENVPRLVDEETLLPPCVALFLLRLQILLLLSHEERRRGDDDRYEPHDADHGLNPLGRPFAVVADGFRDGPVAVEADGAEVDDGGGAKQNVQSQVEGAPGGTEVPVAHDLEGRETSEDVLG